MVYKSEMVYSCDWLGIEAQHRESEIRALKGDPFYKLLLPDGVMILPITPQKQLVLIRQFRPAVERITLEIPSGAVDPGEDAMETAIRELYEETGYHCESHHLVGDGVVRMDREDAMNSYVVGLNATLDPNFVATEDIDVVLVDAVELPQMVLDKNFDHIAALPILLMAQWKLGIDLINRPYG